MSAPQSFRYVGAVRFVDGSGAIRTEYIEVEALNAVDALTQVIVESESTYFCVSFGGRVVALAPMTPAAMTLMRLHITKLDFLAEPARTFA